MTTNNQRLDFDPNGPAPTSSGIFGLPFTVEDSRLVILPVPWEATTSYGGGTANGPKAIFEASHQVDLYDRELGLFYEEGICILPISTQIKKLNSDAKRTAQKVIKALNSTKGKVLKEDLKKVNRLSETLNAYVYKETKKLLARNKIVATLGGDHSCPFGSIQAYVEAFPETGVLHFDAHADLRNAYEGFNYSHASIMFNVLKKTSLQKLVQVGIRDFCKEEMAVIESMPNRVKTFFDEDLAMQKHNGKSWGAICSEIVDHLPREVFISFDIDGLNPTLCPNTGTPVPGGLEFQEALTLIKTVVKSGRQIIGFDLNEVAPPQDGSSEWDANVGARLLFKLCGWTLKSLNPTT